MSYSVALLLSIHRKCTRDLPPFRALYSKERVHFTASETFSSSSACPSCFTSSHSHAWITSGSKGESPSTRKALVGSSPCTSCATSDLQGTTWNPVSIRILSFDPSEDAYSWTGVYFRFVLLYAFVSFGSAPFQRFTPYDCADRQRGIVCGQRERSLCISFFYGVGWTSRPSHRSQ